MKKRIFILGTFVLLLLAIWLFNQSEATNFIDLYTTPRMGSFEVDVTTTGELRAKILLKLEGHKAREIFGSILCQFNDLFQKGV